MPLKKGKSKSVVSDNIREFHSGKTYAHTAAKFGKKDADKQAIAAALSTARRSRKYAEGGAAGDDYNTALSPEKEKDFQAWKLLNAPNDSGGDYDLRGAYQSGMQRDPMSGHFFDQFKKPNHPTFSDQSQYAPLAPHGTWTGDAYSPPAPMADGGDTLPDVGDPAIGDGGQFFEGTRFGNKAADIGSKLGYGMMTGAVTSPYHIAKNMVEGSQESMQDGMGELSPKSIQGSGDLVMQGVGQTAGVRPSGASLASGPIAHITKEDFQDFLPKKTERPSFGEPPKGSIMEMAMKEKAAKEHPDYLDFEQMGNGKYEVFDPVSGKTHHTVDTEPEARQMVGALSPGDKFRQYAKAIVADPREYARVKGGYTEPAYRGLSLDDMQPAKSVHDFTGEEFGHMYSTANPDLADMYAGALTKHPGRVVPENTFQRGATVAPLYVNPKDYHYYNADGGSWGVHNDRAIKEALKQGKPGVIVDNVWDEPGSTKNLGKPNKVYITFKSGAPTVKSRFASKFDPTSADMLRARTGLSGGLPIDTEEKAGGGGVGGNFNPERGAAFGLAKEGMINSSVPGRTDKLNLNVATGSYILPADTVSALGQGNSAAGSSILNRMFAKGPYGMNMPKSKGPRVGIRHASLSKIHFADGGQTEATPIVAAGGEYVITPDTIRDLGNGDMDLGHQILDAFVRHVREKHVKTLKGLKPPKGSKDAKRS